MYLLLFARSLVWLIGSFFNFLPHFFWWEGSSIGIIYCSEGVGCPWSGPRAAIGKAQGPPASGNGFPQLRVSHVVVVHMDCHHIVNCKEENSWKKLQWQQSFWCDRFEIHWCSWIRISWWRMGVSFICVGEKRMHGKACFILRLT